MSLKRHSVRWRCPGTAEGAGRRSIVVGLIGTTLVWYDFFLYVGASVVVFRHQFFAPSAPLTGVLPGIGLYGAGLVARPLGGLFFGHLGERFGRRVAVVATLLLTGASTAAIGVLPTYGQIGVGAPLLLVALRLLQGLGLGGARGSAAVMSWEATPPERRGWVSSWAQIGAPAGNLLAFGVVAAVSGLMTPGEFLAWGWRVPFLFSGLLVAAGLWARVRIAETGPFEALVSTGSRAERPVAVLVRGHRTELVTAAALALPLLFRTGSLPVLAVGCLAALIAFAAMYAPQAGLIAELFPSRVRLSGTAAGYQLAGLLGGALAVSLAGHGPAWARAPLTVPLYAVAALVVSGATLLIARSPREAISAISPKGIGT
ncbi:MFS transporter [Streptomyces sp. NPDC053079]|uniref:MFS transporter n=1 Tax=Streptomyces sp. NPDC053079 TaxID=3365697 RepID=UPI0037CF747F